MLARYCFLVTYDELQNLSASTKKELAELDGEFAKLVGVPTAANPPAQPSNPRPVAQQNGTNVLLPDRNQVNQQNSPDYNAAVGGAIPGLYVPNAGAPPAVMTQPVPSAMPIFTGIPPAPAQPQPMAPAPMQEIPGMPRSQPLTPPMLPTTPRPEPQYAPQPQYTPAPPVQQAPQGFDLNQFKAQFVPQIVNRLGPAGIPAFLNKAVQQGVLSRASLDVIDANNAGAFVQFANTYAG